ncbi:MAG TPA: hypothetical protein VK448_09560, partial [Dissulfurispiraceae bacterium]|nr:hypothetical protein [Dissulfurispiraceae bacterium]
DEEVGALLQELDLRIGATQNAMSSAGIVRECADCAGNDQGTCCGVRTGYKSGSVLLLINLLLGRSLPSGPSDTSLCYFLTERGCALRARHVICVNFICQRLKDAIPHDALCKVQEIAGREIDILFTLEECVNKKMSRGALSASPASSGPDRNL